MLSALMNFLKACWQPSSNQHIHAGSDGMGRQDGLLWVYIRAAANLLDSSAVYEGAAGMAAGAVGVGAVGQIVGSRNRSQGRYPGGESSRNVLQDMRAAQQWLVDFLKERKCSSGKDIAEKFGLWRVRYRDDGQIAWVCRWHKEGRANEIMEVPI